VRSCVGKVVNQELEPVLLLHRCYTVVTLLLHCCYTVVTPLFHSCYTVVARLLNPMLQWCYRIVTVVSRLCNCGVIGGVTVVLQ
jgi:hypothetical protein